MKLIDALNIYFKTGKKIGRHDGVFHYPKYDAYYSFNDLGTEGWEVETDPKPRLLAWRCVDKNLSSFGGVVLLPERGPVYKGEWKRVPHLDEPPETK